MQHRIEISLPSDRTPELLGVLRGLDGVIGLQVQRGTSEQPTGDVVIIDALTAAHLDLLTRLDGMGIGQDPSSSMSLTSTGTTITPRVRESLPTETPWMAWEAIHSTMARESNMTLYGLATMFAAGVIAAVGIGSGALHLVIGGMLIAPGFVPIVRIPFGLLVRNGGWRWGVRDTLLGYLFLIIGAFLAGLVLAVGSSGPFEGPTAYLAVDPLVAFWTSISLPSAVIALVGGFVGSVVIGTGRSVLTAGVMVAVALIPSSAIGGMAIAAGDWPLATLALARWGAEVGLVLIGSVPLWVWWTVRVQRRRSLI